MSKTAELERMARLVQADQAETRMRVDAVEAKVDNAAAETGGRAATPPAAPSLDGLYGWRPEAFSVWFTTGGGGKVGVCYPKDCASYGGKAVSDDLLTPGVQEDPDTKFRWCEMPAPQESEPVLVYTLVVDVDPGTEEPGDEVTGAFLEWTSGVEAAKNVHEAEGTKKAVACVPVARYDAKLDRLSQVHTGALALGGLPPAPAAVAPGPFEPVFVNGVMTDVGEGLWPFGRQFYGTVTVDSSVGGAAFIVLEITHNVTGAPTAVVKGQNAVAIANDSFTKTTLPLYSIEGGRIKVDYRCLLALAVRE